MIKSEYKLSFLWDKICLEDKHAFTTMHKQLSPELVAFAKKWVEDEEVAKDIIQDLFLKLWQKKTAIGRIENVKGYLYKAVRSMSFNYLRSIKQKHKFFNSYTLSENIYSIEDYLINEENSLKLRMTMKGALNRLPVRQREMIHLNFYENLNYNEIVIQTGIQYQSVVNHVHRAVKVLRSHLKSKENVFAV